MQCPLLSLLNCSLDACITQERLPYSIIRHLPWNHFGRKNLGYLFAIHHGAKVIYDTDDDNEIIETVKAIPYTNLTEIDRFLVIKQDESAAEKGSINPYPFFGAPLAWPRGFPLDEVRASTTTRLAARVVQEDKPRSIGVIQSLANHDPDVDAIYRMSTLPLPFDFQSPRDPVLGIRPGYNMCPYNAQATIHMERAFWLMLLPITVHGRVSDIWRSYFTECLFSETGDAVAFASSWVVQHRNPHNYLADFDSEQDLYKKSTALVDYLLNEWTCDASSDSLDLWSCLESLYKDMYSHGVLERQDVEMVQAWINDLKNIGYQPPGIPLLSSKDTYRDRVTIVDRYTLVEEDGNPSTEVSIEFDSMPSLTHCDRSWAKMYTDNSFSSSNATTFPTSISPRGDAGKMAFALELSNVDKAKLGEPTWLAFYCQVEATRRVHKYQLSDSLVLMPVFKDILSVVNFNSFDDKYKPKILEEYLLMHGQAFPHTIFITTQKPTNVSLLAPQGPLHYLPELRNGWALYRGMEYAMRTYPDYKGYMVTNNDVAMRFWKWGQRRWDQVSIQSVNKEVKDKMGCWFDYQTPLNDAMWGRWDHWKEERSTHFLQKFISTLNAVDKENMFRPCGPNILYNTGSDFFYIPGQLRPKYLSVMDSFEDDPSSTLFEALVPMILSILQSPTEWEPLNANYCWDLAADIRNEMCAKLFRDDSTIDIVHPWKLAYPKTKDILHPLLSLPEKKIWLDV